MIWTQQNKTKRRELAILHMGNFVTTVKPVGEIITQAATIIYHTFVSNNHNNMSLYMSWLSLNLRYQARHCYSFKTTNSVHYEKAEIEMNILFSES